MNWKPWVHSLIAAAISAFSTAITTSIADPTNFNFTKPGLEHLLSVAVISAILAVMALLKQSPLPPKN